MNRTSQLGNHTLHCVDVLVSIMDSISMQNTQNNNRTNTINDSKSLLQLLNERLLLWDQQDAAQAAGEWHQALALENPFGPSRLASDRAWVCSWPQETGTLKLEAE